MLAINSDRAKVAIAHARKLPWRASPQAGVERRMLERIGGEVAVATSIVRYAPGSRFDAHTHELGEEFLVLEGTFRDEHGSYPTGTYVRNPPGSNHRPFSDEGCVIFVKLRQMNPKETRRVALLPHEMLWTPATPRRQSTTLHESTRETVTLELLHPGCTIPARTTPGGEELFVVDGTVQLQGGRESLGPWGWFRNPAVAQPALACEDGALLWIKRGHLRAR
jgi:anti-sigma factor ChrR (cupin superfamily)